MFDGGEGEFRWSCGDVIIGGEVVLVTLAEKATGMVVIVDNVGRMGK